MIDERPVLRAAIGRYPHTQALLAGEVRSDRVRLEFEPVGPISRAFAPMVREGRFDVSEIAIATFLQAKAYGKPLVLLPVVLAARFQEAALLCRTESRLRGPQDLAGSRIGVRAYSQTTALWLRGILADDHGISPDQVAWTTFEDAHVAEYRDPAWARRAAPGSDMMAMLRRGELDAVIVGNDVPDDPELRTVFPDPAAAGEAFRAKHGFIPVNHLLTIRRSSLQGRPSLVADIVSLVERSAARASQPFCVVQTPARLAPAIGLALRFGFAQGLLPQPLSLQDVWEG